MVVSVVEPRPFLGSPAPLRCEAPFKASGDRCLWRECRWSVRMMFRGDQKSPRRMRRGTLGALITRLEPHASGSALCDHEIIASNSVSGNIQARTPTINCAA